MDDGADMEAGGDVATRTCRVDQREGRGGDTGGGDMTRWEAIKTSRVQGVGGITGIAIALSIIGGAVYGVIKLVDLVTDDAGAGSPEP
jgi:hypothetical protein